LIADATNYTHFFDFVEIERVFSYDHDDDEKEFLNDDVKFSK
jgi:hypothetical protein